MHPTLKRQLKHIYGDPKNTPANLEELVNAISETYEGFDKDRKMIERSIDISSHELSEANQKLRQEKAKIELEVQKRTDELRRKVEDLEKYEEITTGRELKMVELKEQIRNLIEENQKLKANSNSNQTTI
ncbi:MAG: hypothetical protein R3B41_00480 [Candidatus Doudnabacteria bacterium]